jgi:hypothetical protein
MGGFPVTLTGIPIIHRVTVAQPLMTVKSALRAANVLLILMTRAIIKTIMSPMKNTIVA